jgi:hypothetical protein
MTSNPQTHDKNPRLAGSLRASMLQLPVCPALLTVKCKRELVAAQAPLTTPAPAPAPAPGRTIGPAIYCIQYPVSSGARGVVSSPNNPVRALASTRLPWTWARWPHSTAGTRLAHGARSGLACARGAGAGGGGAGAGARSSSSFWREERNERNERQAGRGLAQDNRRRRGSRETSRVSRD